MDDKVHPHIPGGWFIKVRWKSIIHPFFAPTYAIVKWSNVTRYHASGRVDGNKVDSNRFMRTSFHYFTLGMFVFVALFSYLWKMLIETLFNSSLSFDSEANSSWRKAYEMESKQKSEVGGTLYEENHWTVLRSVTSVRYVILRWFGHGFIARICRKEPSSPICKVISSQVTTVDFLSLLS